MTGYIGTQEDFYTKEITVWGFDHIESLLERGYEAVLTTEGWKWLYKPHVLTCKPTSKLSV